LPVFRVIAGKMKVQKFLEEDHKTIRARCPSSMVKALEDIIDVLNNSPAKLLFAFVKQLSPVSALMPTINCLLSSPGTASTCYIHSFLLSVNSITVFATEVTTTNFLTESLLLMTIAS